LSGLLEYLDGLFKRLILVDLKWSFYNLRFMDKNKRKISNLLAKPDQQIKISAFLALGFLFIILGFVGANLYLTTIKINALSSIYHLDPRDVLSINNSIWSAHVYIAILIILFSASLFLYSIRLTHTFFGPVVAINALIDELRGGEYGRTKELRKDDQLKDVMENLNRLSVALSDQGKSRSRRLRRPLRHPLRRRLRHPLRRPLRCPLRYPLLG